MFKDCYLLGKTISSHAHKTGSWCLLGVLFKIPTSSLVPFHVGFSHPPLSSKIYIVIMQYIIKSKQLAQLQESALHFSKRDDPSVTSERYWKHPIIGNMEPNYYCKENISSLCKNNLKEINKLVDIER